MTASGSAVRGRAAARRLGSLYQMPTRALRSHPLGKHDTAIHRKISNPWAASSQICRRVTITTTAPTTTSTEMGSTVIVAVLGVMVRACHSARRGPMMAFQTAASSGGRIFAQMAMITSAASAVRPMAPRRCQRGWSESRARRMRVSQVASIGMSTTQNSAIVLGWAIAMPNIASSPTGSAERSGVRCSPSPRAW